MTSTAAAHERAKAFLAEAREITDEALDRCLPPDGAGAPRLAEAMRYSVFAGGKRLRPALALATCRTVNGSDEAVAPFLCALELVHTYSLIHDDLPAMDDDDLRRGRPTSHKRFGEAMAILAGDALHTLAFEILLRDAPTPDLAQRLGAELAVAIGQAGMVGGQVEDMAADGQAPTLEHLRRIHAAKTGALIGVAVRGGALVGGASEALLENLGAFGHAIGLAFQITDDILDVVGTSDALGKTPGKDASSGKMTYVALEGLEGARARAADALAEALKALASVADAGPLRDLALYVTSRSH